MERIETIQLGVLAPWEKRVQTVVENAAQGLEANWAVRIAVSGSARNGVVGMGGAISIQNNEKRSFSAVLYSVFNTQYDLILKKINIEKVRIKY